MKRISSLRLSGRRIAALGFAVLALAVGTWAAPKILRRLDMQGLRPIVVAKGLASPWSMAFLPDGSVLVTERPGQMRIVTLDGKVSLPIQGLPKIAAFGEGGLMDVAIDPQFTSNRRIYWSFAEPAESSPDVAATAVARGRLEAGKVTDVQILLRQDGKTSHDAHFGSRLLILPDGTLLVGLGDRFDRPAAQRLDSLKGKIVRINRDGTIPADNPYSKSREIRPEIWSIGHRNVQGLALAPDGKEILATDHGPEGGDELNIASPGLNYGWPIVTFGTEYVTGAKIGEGGEKPGIESPIYWWGPVSIAPSGMAFATSDRYPDWKGQLFVGALRGKALVRLRLSGRRVVEEQAMLTGLLARIRDVREGPDGWLYVLTDEVNGRLIRVER